ncbi:hypothetical protein HK102_010302, partial [Quaeritorhiza haematococci]
MASAASKYADKIISKARREGTTLADMALKARGPNSQQMVEHKIKDWSARGRPGVSHASSGGNSFFVSLPWLEDKKLDMQKETTMNAKKEEEGGKGPVLEKWLDGEKGEKEETVNNKKEESPEEVRRRLAFFR